MLLVAVVASGIALAMRPESAAHRRAEAIAVSEKFTKALASYDYRHLDQDFAGVRALSAGVFRDEYDRTLASVRSTLVTNHAVATVKIVSGPYLVSLNGDAAKTYTIISQSLGGSDVTAPTQRSSRIELTLVHTSAGWRVEHVSNGA